MDQVLSRALEHLGVWLVVCMSSVVMSKPWPTGWTHPAANVLTNWTWHMAWTHAWGQIGAAAAKNLLVTKHGFTDRYDYAVVVGGVYIPFDYCEMAELLWAGRRSTQGNECLEPMKVKAAMAEQLLPVTDY